ncbi:MULTISPECIES: glycosyltransferase family 4 protein [Rhodobacterales]|jgi:glycosyltransferase involved in cell wall biosynthesis|uniref:glycosyltransferase family 4 protein n=1 Tax=Rhodobacterales TaxID=204455 RepID=UPI00237EEDFD|nr:glycosyltransferase family 4 protein [Phaeobacter gallaeciensis]MDE4139434.1 glycosyltransferase family 4 protein [Phaeobacter gallaeciensis]MDE4147508.1 glycosyltransferase family 4 protein [Phaeobacter gallaeciensis]MDE4151727.1 glycosyltransferase family 4 protein [Phaeobacter gallaeciensis]MDE4227489.1 glycosyltransferase family 4 protein [Phaeobacter gallaeciensis]MDE4256191.1 glycosyltransferase family 4 protein [Phaeobacter gallaeciensis]
MTLPKLAYLTGEYPRASDTFIQREVTALRALGHDVLTCSIRTTGAEHLVGPEQRQEHALTFKVLGACKKPLRLLRAHLRWMRNPGRYIAALRLAWKTAPRGVKGRLYNLIYFLEAGVLADELRRQEVDHLHNHIATAACTVAMLASELSGIPYSFTIHGPDIFFNPNHWRIDEKAARARFVACISEFCRSQLMCFADQSHWARFHIIHCGIDPGRYTSAPHKGANLLFVGRLAAVKGLPILLDALRDLSGDWKLTVIGDGPDRAALEAQAQGLNVDFLGYRSQSEVAEALSNTDVFVLPSFAEGVPVVLMEAMASAVPVVATRIAGIPELVDHATSGLLVPPGDPQELRAALDHMLADSKARQDMGLAGRAKVSDDFNIHTEAARLSRLFTSYSGGSTVLEKRP